VQRNSSRCPKKFSVRSFSGQRRTRERPAHALSASPPIELRPCIRFVKYSEVRYLSFDLVEQVPSERDLRSMSVNKLCDMLKKAQ
jgi:hypothetical protein